MIHNPQKLEKYFFALKIIDFTVLEFVLYCIAPSTLVANWLYYIKRSLRLVHRNAMWKKRKKWTIVPCQCERFHSLVSNLHTYNIKT